MIIVSGPFMWFDLAAEDSGKAAAFYRDLFGWDVAEVPDAGYQAWIGTGRPWAGIVTAITTTTAQDAPLAGGRWLPYVVVDDLAEATQKAVKLGVTVLREATDGPAGTSVRIADPGGAQLALFKPFPAAT